MRRKFNPKLKEFCIQNSNLTIDELLPLVNTSFKEVFTRLQLQKYLIRNNIPYKYKQLSKSHKMGLEKVLLSEYTKDDGMVRVKVSRNKWKYKQRYIYEKYHNIELKDDEYIIFLDNDRTNFRIDNLMKVDRRTASYLRNHYLKSDNPEYTKLGIELIKLMIKIKDMEATND